MFEFNNRRSIKKIRKGRRCVHCGTVICPGEPATREIGRWDGDFYQHFAHPDCGAMWLAVWDKYQAIIGWEDGMDLLLLEALGEDEDDDTILAALQAWEDDYPFVVARIKSAMKKGSWSG